VSDIDLNSQEIKDAIAAAVEDATRGLKDKNTELLGKLKKAQQGQQIDPADYAALEAERDDLKAKLTDANKSATKALKDAEAAAKRAADLDSAFNNSLKEAALTEALTKANVTNPAYIKAAKAVLAAQANVVEENGARIVKAGDKALADYITEWAGSDEGKHFVTAPDTNGGGAQGGSRVTPGSKPIKEWSDAEKAGFIRENGLDAWKKQLAAQ
jgi:hypothetical protein